MSSTLANNLSRAKIQQLLAAVGSQPIEDAAQSEVTEYNWHQPRYFNNDQLKRLDDFTKKVAAAVAEKFAHFYQSDFNVTITSTTQHFAGELFSQISETGQNDYYLAFGNDQEHLCGFISIPAQTAIAWVTLLLGDSESEKDPSRVLSQLEESLLLDIASAIVEALSTSLHGYYNFQPGKGISRGKLPIEPDPRGAGSLQGIEELYRIVFSVEKTGSENNAEVYFLIPCSRLAPVVGKTTKVDSELSAEDISKVILGHLQQMPISVTAQLTSTMLTFEEVVSLHPCDVLLLDKAIDEPVELIVEGLTAFRGQLAKSDGQKVLVITELSCNTGQNTSPVRGTK